MANILKILLAAWLLLGALPLSASEPERWDCIVEDFRTADNNDEDFRQANLDKKFELIISDKDVIVKSMSSTFSDSERRYLITDRKFIEVTAIGESIVNTDIIVFSEDRVSGGFFNATITIQGSFFVNSWILGCGTLPGT